MKARVLGFNWQPIGGIDLLEFVGHLKSVNKQIEWGAYKRLLFIEDLGDCWGGLVLSIKNQKLFAELIEKGGKLAIVVRELGKDNSAIDYNFVVISKKTARGIYLHYHQSFSMNQFNHMCARQYKEL